MEAVLKLLKRYKFDLGDRSLTQISIRWSQYDPNWLRLAVTEALYRGRYKVISVEQILETWQRKQQPHIQFDQEFECLVWGNAHSDHPSQPVTEISPSPELEILRDNSPTMIEKLRALCQS